jgi:hypothetical protein
LVHAARRSSAPTIDGDLGEWALSYTADHVVWKPSNWAGAPDQNVRFAMGWDNQFLYLAALVGDDVHVQTQHGEVIYKGDSLELLLDVDLAADFALTGLSADDYQLGISPGAFAGDGPEAYLWFPASRAARPGGVLVAARPSGNGYQLEAAIPWSLFNATPAGGARYGMALSSSDNDAPGRAEQQSLISTAPRRSLLDPTTWGTLVLDN